MALQKILLVDDEINIRIVLGAILEQQGYMVDAAEDGFAALRRIQQSMPDLVISDLRMPNMNGFELLSFLRGKFPDLPAIAISGEFFSDEVQESTIAEAFFQKGNYEVGDLLAKVSSLLNDPAGRVKSTRQTSPVWAPTGDAPAMLTCIHCLHSFPIDPVDLAPESRETDCVFCGAHLKTELVACGRLAG